MPLKNTILFTLIVLCLVACRSEYSEIAIFSLSEGDRKEQLAAKELQRYIYQMTDTLPDISTDWEFVKQAKTKIIVGSFTNNRIQQIIEELGVADKTVGLEEQEFYIKSFFSKRGKTILIVGGDSQGALYGVYDFLEKQGVWFDIDSEVIPEGKTTASFLPFEKRSKPLFNERGLLPFHDFPEGPDWWNTDDYKALFTRMARMKMNFIGLHSYPATPWGPEPTVWQGLPEDVNEDGTVKYSYPTSYHMTMRLNGYGEKVGSPKRWWGYSQTSTSQFSAGANQLFETDNYGPDCMNELQYAKMTPEQAVQVVNETGEMFNEAFSFAQELGIKTCLGTETPLLIPNALQDHLKKKGIEPSLTIEKCEAEKDLFYDVNVLSDSMLSRKLYEGMFLRLSRAMPLDYYWIWTPESWLGNVPENVLQSTISDINAAQEALNQLDNPFQLATCGWVIGPPNDRNIFDRILPQESPISCINRNLGFGTVDSAFKESKGRPKWIIPWLEDDQVMMVPQFWTGRVRRDAADAYAYGATGLMGIHWRTKPLAPAIKALALAGWDQTGWNLNFTYPKDSVDNEVSEKTKAKSRDLPCLDFYENWCAAQFGATVGDQLAAIFSKLDGGGDPLGIDIKKRNSPIVSWWINGPGTLIPNQEKWETVKSKFDFVNKMESYRPLVTGKGDLARFEYWLNSFRYYRTMGELGCLRGELDMIIEKLKKPKLSGNEKEVLLNEAIVQRVQLARLWERMVTELLMATDTPGGMGSIANLEQHSRGTNQFLNKHDVLLKSLSGKPLPKQIEISESYQGDARIIIPTVRSIASRGEKLKLKVIFLDSEIPKTLKLKWRTMGEGKFLSIPLTHVARGVYNIVLPQVEDGNLEYYIQADTGAGQTINWPATAPEINQTLVILDTKENEETNSVVNAGLDN